MTYRLYVDEAGDHGTEAASLQNNPYFSVTGIALSLNDARAVLVPRLAEMKWKHFQFHPDDGIALHRKEIVGRSYPFKALLDPVVHAAFNEDILELYRSLDYTVITVVIDKAEQVRRYKTVKHPYHYCMSLLLERYCRWLCEHRTKGDVVSEARGGKEDALLRDVVETQLRSGTETVSRDDFGRVMTSSTLRLFTKKQNVAGLQLADLLAHTSQRLTAYEYDKGPAPRGFSAKIAEILMTKYRRSGDGRTLKGYGIKWLP